MSSKLFQGTPNYLLDPKLSEAFHIARLLEKPLLLEGEPGTGKITDEAHRSFILNSPDSATKFLLRKELDGKTLKSTQDEIYESWQNRGLSRGKLRKHFLKIMEWDSVPELEVSEIYEQVKDKVYEIKHT